MVYGLWVSYFDGIFFVVGLSLLLEQLWNCYSLKHWFISQSLFTSYHSLQIKFWSIWNSYQELLPDRNKMLCELLTSKPVMSHGNQIAQVNKEDLILQEQTGSYFHCKCPRESFQVGRHSVKRYTTPVLFYQ